VKLFWIIPNKKQYAFLKTIFPKDQFLFIGEKEVLAYSCKVVNIVLKINELVYNYINTNTIQFVFGEVTWIHGLFVHGLTKNAKEIKCEYLNHILLEFQTVDFILLVTFPLVLVVL